ncbi:SPOR domain-containing protein [Polymorphobacter sp.]|uniref:SPOR domain-containing protein n=1 Tax=Polymorphobacter sp. TaxID=1909290 RepID=UPI003F72A120
MNALIAALALIGIAGPATGQGTAPAAPAAAVLTPSISNGVRLWQRGEWAAAVRMWQPFADGGNPDAMYNIGQARKLGRGLPRDEVQARAWFRRAAERGHRPAQANLGILLFQLGEKPEALRWLKTAADAGEPRAQYVYGVASWNGDGVARSLTIAYAYLARAADQGLEEAASALNRLTPRITPAERAAGWAMASSMARTDGKVAPLTRVANPMPQAVAAAPAVPSPVPQLPTSDPAALGAPAPPATGTQPGTRVQIGAYSRRELAEADLASLRQSRPGLLEGVGPRYEAANGLVRLQLGPYASLDVARAACQRFVAAGRACLVVDTP